MNLYMPFSFCTFTLEALSMTKMSMGEDFHGIIQSLGWECMWFLLWYKIVKVLKSNKILQYGMNNFHGNHMYNLQIGIFFCFVKTWFSSFNWLRFWLGTNFYNFLLNRQNIDKSDKEENQQLTLKKFRTCWMLDHSWLSYVDI